MSTREDDLRGASEAVQNSILNRLQEICDRLGPEAPMLPFFDAVVPGNGPLLAGFNQMVPFQVRSGAIDARLEILAETENRVAWRINYCGHVSRWYRCALLPEVSPS